MTIHDIPSFNITSSLRLSLEWAHENCSIADYIFFITDETFVNPYLLHDYIMHNMNPNEVYIDGLTRHTSLPVRKYNREGFVSKVLYPDMIFPPFTEFSNGALLSRKVIVDPFFYTYLSISLPVLAKELKFSAHNFSAFVKTFYLSIQAK